MFSAVIVLMLVLVVIAVLGFFGFCVAFLLEMIDTYHILKAEKAAQNGIINNG